MRTHFLLSVSIAALTLTSANTWGATINKCKNQQGDTIYQKSPCKADAVAISSWESAADKAPPPQAELKKPAELIIKQHANGSYFVDASINGKALTLVVDTGASLVSLPKAFAREARLSCQDSIDMQTANGASKACSTTIKKLSFGPFFVSNVDVIIAPHLTQPLLGMNVLSLFKIAQDSGEMRLSKREEKKPQ